MMYEFKFKVQSVQVDVPGEVSKVASTDFYWRLFLGHPVGIGSRGKYSGHHHHQNFTNTAPQILYQPLFLLLGSECFLEALTQAQAGEGGAPLVCCAGRGRHRHSNS